MTQENIEKIRNAVKTRGDLLKHTLKPTMTHPVRNPWAHVWQTLGAYLGTKRYDELPDEQVEQILQVIELIT